MAYTLPELPYAYNALEPHIDARTMEAFPATYQEIAPVHQELLTKNGVYILEHVDTRELVKDSVHEFLFVLGVPKLSGTVQGIIHPIAIR